MELLYFYGLLTILSAVSSRVVDVLPRRPGKQLFLSRHVVTEAGEFDGGVLVNEKGIIDAVLRRDIVNSILVNYDDLKIIDGGELALMAGGVDSHVHVNEPGRTSWEGYVTATQAAATGGITTIIDMPLNSIPPTTTVENLKTKAAMAKEEVFVDVGFWGGVIPGNEIDLHDLIRAGVVGFKCFLTDSGVSEFPNISPNELPNVFEILNGTGTVLAFHAEVTLNTTDKECTTDCPSPVLYDTYLATHPEEMELQAVSLVASLLPQTDVHVHIVHVSAAGVVPILEAAREQRIKAGYSGWKGGVTAETCHHYLTLSSEQIPPGHSEYKCSPPIRNITNKQKLWKYIKDGRLDLVTSDHSPSVEELKGTDFLKAWGGISSMQFDFSLFWTEAKARGLSLSTMSHYLSAGPARLVGLQHRKGSIRPGLDADLIFFDPNASFVVTPEVIQYKNKISPYMNRVLTGIVRRTYLRGELIYANGELMGTPQGHLLLNDEVTEKRIPGRAELYSSDDIEKLIARSKKRTSIEAAIHAYHTNLSEPNQGEAVSNITKWPTLNPSDVELNIKNEANADPINDIFNSTVTPNIVDTVTNLSESNQDKAVSNITKGPKLNQSDEEINIYNEAKPDPIPDNLNLSVTTVTPNMQSPVTDLSEPNQGVAVSNITKWPKLNQTENEMTLNNKVKPDPINDNLNLSVTTAMPVIVGPITDLSEPKQEEAVSNITKWPKLNQTDDEITINSEAKADPINDNLSLIVTTETPNVVGPVKNWFNKVFNRTTRVSNNFSLLTAVSLVITLLKYIM